jgi:hypothetical protein
MATSVSLRGFSVYKFEHVSRKNICHHIFFCVNINNFIDWERNTECSSVAVQMMAVIILNNSVTLIPLTWRLDNTHHTSAREVACHHGAICRGPAQWKETKITA